MKAHWRYLCYVIRHKWFVYQAGRWCNVGFWRLLIHDWTKFLPCEWFAYVEKFYGKKIPVDEPDDFRYWQARGPVDAAFDHAWNHHQKANKHHWQYWLLTNDSDEPKHKALDMPVKYRREMIADWMGAGRAISGKWEVWTWYEKNRNRIILSEHTRTKVEEQLAFLKEAFRLREQLGIAA